METTDHLGDAPDPGRPFDELRSSGLLWLINTSVFHPRGYALALHQGEDGKITGWSIVGDGNERWAFAEDGWPDDWNPDAAFLAVKALLP